MDDIFPGIDIFVIFGLIVLIDRSGLATSQAFQLGLHPFWIPVVLAVVQYGMVPGLVAVCMAAGLDWAVGWWAPAGQADYYAYLLDNLREPILWLLTVGVLGLIRQRQFDAMEELREEAGERGRQAETLAERCQALRQEIARLEHAVVSSGARNAGLSMEVLDEVAAAPPHRLEEVFRHALSRLLGAQGIEILVFDNRNERQPVEARGASRPKGMPLGAPIVSPPLVQALLSSNGPLSCAREHDASLLAGEAAMAASIPGSGGEVVGFVLVGEVDPACLSTAGEAALSLSCFILGGRISHSRTMILDAASATRPQAGDLLPGRYTTNATGH